VITLPTAETPLASRIATDKKYKTFFTDCVGALDGTHINVTWAVTERTPTVNEHPTHNMTPRLLFEYLNNHQVISC